MTNRKMYLIASACILVLSAFTIIDSAKLNLSKDYEVRFTSNDPSGIFTDLKGDIFFNEKDLESSKFNMAIQVASINTGNGMQNSHAKSEKWFDAGKYPEILFTSSKIIAKSSGY